MIVDSDLVHGQGGRGLLSRITTLPLPSPGKQAGGPRLLQLSPGRAGGLWLSQGHAGVVTPQSRPVTADTVSTSVLSLAFACGWQNAVMLSL